MPDVSSLKTSADVVTPMRRSGTPRFVALDGLRGVAAVIVVAYHAVLASDLGDAFLGVLDGEPTGSQEALLLANSPLHYGLMGPEAVIVFFVLSGFVLVLPLLNGRGMDLWEYYPRRVLRLWLPSAASVVLAVLIILSTSQHPGDAHSEWGRFYSVEELDAGTVLDSLFLITGTTHLNNPLWSLRWELLFSLFLPVAFLLVARITRGHWAWLVACGILSGSGAFLGVQALTWGPMFLAGGIVAARVRAEGPDVPRRAPWAWLVGGVLILGVPDTVRVALGVTDAAVLSGLGDGAVTVGAALIVYGLSRPSALAALFTLRPIRFLGRISFSLYLVHAPILIGAIHVAPEHPRRALAVAVPVAFVVAWLFARFVEEPSARLARRVGALASAAAHGWRDPVQAR